MSSRTPDRPALPSLEDPVVAGLANAVGGRPGSHARLRERRLLTPVRWVVLLTLLTSLLALWQKTPCRTHAWVEEYQYTRACYTDVFALYGATQLDDGEPPYLERPLSQPVLTGAAMWVAAEVAEQFPQPERNRRFFDVTWVLLTAAAVVVAVTTARLAGTRRVWDAALFGTAPALVLHHTMNWDLLGAALAGLALLAWARRRPVLFGALLGAATAARLYPLLFLLPLLPLCWRAGRLPDWGRAAGTALATAALLFGSVYLVSPSYAVAGGTPVEVAASPLERLGDEGLDALAPRVTVPDPTNPAVTVRGTNAVAEVFVNARERGADWDTVWYALGRLDPQDDGLRGRVADSLLGRDLPGEQAAERLNRVVALSFVLLLAGIAALALRARRRPRVAQLLFLTVAAYCLTSKVFSPSYVIWLLPLAVLARPRWRPFLLWQATEVAVLFSRFYFFISNDKPGQGIGYGWFLGAVLLRDLALVAYCAYVVRDVVRPERDVVRTDPLTGEPTGVDDPAGGVLDGAPDRAADGAAGGAAAAPRRTPPLVRA